MPAGELFPKLEPRAPIVPVRPGGQTSLLRAEPIYRQEGYEEALGEIWLRGEVRRRLDLAAASLTADGYALKLWDGWRPLQLQRTLWTTYKAELEREIGLSGEPLEERLGAFVSPVDSAVPPPHATGGAVDLTLCSSDDGSSVDMGGDFDELTDRSLPGYYEGRPLAADEVVFRDRRRLLAAAMVEAGFWQLPTEWWHFEYGTAGWAKGTGAAPIFDLVEAEITAA